MVHGEVTEEFAQRWEVRRRDEQDGLPQVTDPFPLDESRVAVRRAVPSHRLSEDETPNLRTPRRVPAPLPNRARTSGLAASGVAFD